MNWVGDWNEEIICIGGLSGSSADKKPVGWSDLKHNWLNRMKNEVSGMTVSLEKYNIRWL